jgi:hypothetical protein
LPFSSKYTGTATHHNCPDGSIKELHLLRSLLPSQYVGLEFSATTLEVQTVPCIKHKSSMLVSKALGEQSASQTQSLESGPGTEQGTTSSHPVGHVGPRPRDRLHPTTPGKQQGTLPQSTGRWLCTRSWPPTRLDVGPQCGDTTSSMGFKAWPESAL